METRTRTSPAEMRARMLARALERAKAISAMRPGTADCDFNPLAMELSVPAWVLAELIKAAEDDATTQEALVARADSNADSCRQFVKALEFIRDMTNEPVVHNAAKDAIRMAWLQTGRSSNG